MSEELFDYENEIVSNEKADELKNKGIDNLMSSVMSDQQGRKVMALIIYCICGLDDAQFTGNSKTYFNLGSREVGRYLSQMIQESCFEDYILMLRELRDSFKNEEVKNG